MQLMWLAFCRESIGLAALNVQHQEAQETLTNDAQSLCDAN